MKRLRFRLVESSRLDSSSSLHRGDKFDIKTSEGVDGSLRILDIYYDSKRRDFIIEYEVSVTTRALYRDTFRIFSSQYMKRR